MGSKGPLPLKSAIWEDTDIQELMDMGITCSNFQFRLVPAEELPACCSLDI